MNLSLSTRYSSIDVDIGCFEDPDTYQAASFKDNWDNVSSAISASYSLFGDQSNTVFAGVSQSFRVANIADLSRFGRSRTNETEVAATDLSPEAFLTYETGYQFKGDTQRITTGGTPSYQLVNIHSGWQATKYLLLTLQLNNVFDEAYRSYGSGFNESGRNLILGSTLHF